MECVLCKEKLYGVRIDLVIHGEKEQTIHCCAECFYLDIPDVSKDEEKMKERKEAIARRNETIIAMATT